MTRHERLLATLRGGPVDRPAVSFYEIGGFRVNPADPSPFNIYSAPDWQPLLELAETRTDLMRMCSPHKPSVNPDLVRELHTSESTLKNGSQFCRTVVRAPGRTLTSLARRDPGVNTVWTLEHLLKDADDLEAYLRLPDDYFAHSVDISPLEDCERSLGDAGLVLIDTPDPICNAASLFAMEDYTVLAMTEPVLFHRLLEKLAAPLWRETEETAARFPGRLWRIFGPEFASEPYLPPSLFSEYVVRYTGPMVKAIQAHGGFARIHCHGRLRNILPLIASMDPAGLDPVEPEPQGDVRLIDVRRDYGKRMVLFGNLEASDVEQLPPPAFERKVRTALEEGTAGEGRGFVLMPSASPYGRTLTPHTLENYRTMVRLAEQWGPGGGP